MVHFSLKFDRIVKLIVSNKNKIAFFILQNSKSYLFQLYVLMNLDRSL